MVKAKDCYIYEEGSDFVLKWTLDNYLGRVFLVKRNGEKVLVRG